MKLAVSHHALTMIRFEVNGVVIPYSYQQQEYIIDVSRDSVIEVFFEPWKTQPLIRIDNHLIDYWLASVEQFDHMIRFRWNFDFYQKYQQKIIQGKIDYLNLKTQEEIDYYLGINNSNQDLVTQIKQYLQ